jgi:hypothetical protein
MKCLNSAAGLALSYVFMLASLSSAQTKGSDPPSITVCDLFKDLRAHAGRMISVRGMLYQGRETIALGAHCDSKFVTTYNWAPVLKDLPELPPTGEFVWPTALDLKPASFVEEGETPVKFQTEEGAIRDVFASIATQWAKLTVTPGQRADVLVTVVGQLRVKSQYFIGKGGDGVLIGGGYGHLNTYPAQLVIKTMYDLVVQRK